MNGLWRQYRAAIAAMVLVLFISGCGAVKGTLNVVGGAGKLTFGAAKATVDLAQGSVRVAQGGVRLAQGAVELGAGAGRSALQLTQQGFQTAGSAVRLADQADEASHRSRMRRITESRAASAGR